METLDLRSLLPGGSDYSELKVQENRSTTLQILNGSVTANSSSSSAGIMSRIRSGGVWGLASSPLISVNEMRRVAAKALSNARLLSARVKPASGILASAPAQGEYLMFSTRPKASNQARIDFLMAVDAYIGEKYPDLASRMVINEQLEMEKHIVTTDGSEFRVMTPRSYIVVLMTIMHEGEPLMHYDFLGGFGQWEDNFEDPGEFFPLADKIYRELIEKKDAVFARGGNFDCVLDSQLAGILSHEAIGHTTEADIVLGGSIAGDYLNQPVASEIVTLMDIANTWDGRLCPVPVFIDDEGTDAKDAVIIENGILKGYMSNKETAMKLNLPLTGNSRAFAYSDEPLVRMRNTMIVPGKDKLQDMIASIEDGYYLIKPSNGQADWTSEFSFGVSHGYEIKNGQLGKPIKETTISGIAFKLLKTITMISDEMAWTTAGMCGKKQMIPVGMGGPSIKCKATIGGRS